MPQSYEQYLLELKRYIETALEATDQQIVEYLPTSNDEQFVFLIKKAIQYRETLKKINEELSKL
ncbi:hypothetical protein [Runella zeae]|uniref:hypothetical protein n=1 Tax=Runella zeae TaxID=94255 RepID=UPI0003F57622|nr:hypothetical protein [Runella zeae]